MLTWTNLKPVQAGARTRSFKDRFLGKDFFQGEPSKPLFHSNNLLTIHNL